MRYKGDPYWTKERFESKCRRCDKQIRRGESIFYYPSSRAVYCDHEACGRQESRSFECAAQDEANYCGTY
jgi:hypothetical protein